MTASATRAAFPHGAAIASGSGNGEAWVLAEDEPDRSLGAALAWAIRQRVARLHLLLNAGAATRDLAAVLARRAALFRLTVDLWWADDRNLSPIAAAAPASAVERLPKELEAIAERIRDAGAEAVCEHGVLSGEVLGLEVCRAVQDEGGWRLAIGVGKYDREIHDTLEADDVTLARVIDEVRRHRRQGAGAHPANTLATERWLRAVVVARPDLVGASELKAVETTQLRTDLRQPAPAAATGKDESGSPLLVVCTAGTVDLEAVPIAADTRLAMGGALVLAVDPAADAPITRDLAATLTEPASMTAVPADWRGLHG